MRQPRFVLREGQVGYPADLVAVLENDTHGAIACWGNQAIWSERAHPLLAFFCSARAPASVMLAAHDLAQGWRHSGLTVVGGFHSPVEQEVLTVLLRGPAPVILCPARSLHGMRPKPTWREAMGAGRLLLVSPFADHVRRSTKQTALARNRFAAGLADVVFIAYAEEGGKTMQLAQEAVARNKPVLTLSHPANAHLVDVGAQATDLDQLDDWLHVADLWVSKET